MKRIEAVFHWLISFSVRRSAVLIALALLACAPFFIGLKYFDLNPSVRDYLGKDRPRIQHLIQLEEEYVSDTNILLMLKPKQGSVFDREVLAAIEELTEAAWNIPSVRRVDSLTNFQHTEVSGDQLIIADLVEDAAALDPTQIDNIRRVALAEPALVNYLVAADGGAAGINIILDIELSDNRQTAEIYRVLNPLKARIRQQYPQLELYESGFVSLTHHWRAGAITDAKHLGILSLLCIVAGLMFFLGNFRATLSVALVGALSVIVGLGLIGFLGVVLNPSSVLSCLMILVLGMADGIHVVKSARRYLADGATPRQAVTRATETNLLPIALTSVTTAIGFLTFNFSSYAGIKIMGNFVAFGVMVAFLLSVTLLPACLLYCGLKPERRSSGQRANQLFADAVIRFRVAILALTVPALLASAYLISFNEIDERITRYLKPGYVFTEHLDAVQAELTGTVPIIYNFNSGEPGGVNEPAFAKKVEGFVEWAQVQPEVRHVSSYTHTLKRLNANMHGGDPDDYRLPESRQLAAQYLLLYELSLPYGLDLTNTVNIDKSATRVVLTINDLSLKAMKKFVERAEEWLQQHAPNFDRRASGDTITATLMAEESVYINIESALLALVIIGLILLFTFRSLYAGALCVLCVLAPMMVTYGVWGWTDGVIDFPASLTVCMVIGLAVDFSVHFISKYVYAQRRLGKDTEDSIRYAFMLVVGPIMTTTVVLGSAFGIISLSVQSFNASLGKATALCIVFSAIATFLLVPSLLLTFKKNYGKAPHLPEEKEAESG